MKNKMNALFTVNLDGECFWSGMFEGTEKRPKTLSMGDYGIKRGLDRVLKTFRDHEVKGTFFVPGLIAERHPEAVEKIRKDGHELAFHGYTHRPMHLLTTEEMEEEFARGTAVFEQVCGCRPIGFRAPEGEVTEEAFQMAEKYGYRYSSSLYDNDMPYWHSGEKKGLLEIPMNWNIHDFPYFAFNYGPAFPIGQSRVSSYQRVTENYVEEFDAYLHYGLTYVAQFTPQSIGSPGKIQILEKILEHMEAERENIRILTGEELYQEMSEETNE
ncbi:MAG: polysaccharide deacetylase family protein [Eubacterium sp.]|nr:polysaccharide deacetylase family protein [Eubacterium sp.]